MKPALSPQTTGFLPTWRTSAETSASTCSSVTTVRTISTRPCTGAGLKKCTPMTRPGWELAVEISVTDSDEVLVARIASGATIASSSRKICFLTSSGLHDRLDDEVGVGEVLQLGAERDPAEQLGLLLLGHLLARRPRGRWSARGAGGRARDPRRSGPRRRPVKPSRANTSAMPAPIVPSPTTPIVSKVRVGVAAASAVASVMRAILFDRPVTRAGGRRTSRSGGRAGPGRSAASRSRAAPANGSGRVSSANPSER